MILAWSDDASRTLDMISLSSPSGDLDCDEAGCVPSEDLHVMARPGGTIKEPVEFIAQHAPICGALVACRSVEWPMENVCRA